MANTFRNDTYRSSKTLSYFVIGLFGALVICSILYILMSIVFMAAPDAQMNLDGGESIHFAYLFIGLISILEILLRLAVIVVFLIWLYRSFNNLSALKARNLEFSPGWAVGWWFVPFANLVKPFQVVRELWNESDPDFDEETGFLHTSAGTPEIIGFWWAAFLLSNFSARISNALIDSNSGNPSTYFPVALIVASVLQIAAATLIIFIVKGVVQRQEQRFARLGISEQVLPPPPTFYQNP